MRTSAYCCLAFVLGLLLLSTAALKTHAAFTAAVFDAGFLSSRWGTLALAEFEFFLGAWLLTGYRAGAARGCALASFICFLGFSLASALAGERSCSCFGNLTLSPWYTSMIDVAAVSALLSCRPQTDNSSTSPYYAKNVFIILIIGLLFALPAALAIRDDAHRPLLVPSEQVVDLGVLSRGGRRSAILRLTNEGVAPVAIDAVESSCPCLTLQDASRVVSPSQTICIVVILDLGKEPFFTGNLRAHVQGRTRSGALAFSIQVTAKVRKL